MGIGLPIKDMARGFRFLPMAVSIRANISRTKCMGRASTSTPTDRPTRASGAIISNTEVGCGSTLRATATWGSGQRGRLRVSVFSLRRMRVDMRVLSSVLSKMGRGRRNLLLVIFIRETTRMEDFTVLDNSTGGTAVFTRGNSLMGRSTGTGFGGKAVQIKNTKASFHKIESRAMEFIRGTTAMCTKATTTQI